MRQPRNIKNKVKNVLKRPDQVIFYLTFVLSIIGLIMVFDASLYAANSNFKGDTFRLVTQQFQWFLGGIVLFFLFSRIPYKIYKKFTFFLIVVTILLLIYTLFTANAELQNGAKRWATIGGLNFQPSEVAKLTFILYLAAWLSAQKPIESSKEFIKKNIISFGVILFAIVGLIAAGKDLSTAILLAIIGIAMYFFFIRNKRHLMAFSLLILAMLMAGVLLVAVESFRIDRFSTFKDINLGHQLSEQELTGNGYQINQMLIGIGSGGMFGKGFTQSVIKYTLPETVSATDAIFAVYGEEFGFVGCMFLVGLYLILVLRGLGLINKIHDDFGQLIVIGVMTWIGAQAFLNIGANVALIPVSGVPLPLISYGGSSLLILLVSIGIVLNISRHRNLDLSSDNQIMNTEKSSVKSHVKTRRRLKR